MIFKSSQNMQIINSLGRKKAKHHTQNDDSLTTHHPSALHAHTPETLNWDWLKENTVIRYMWRDSNNKMELTMENGD
jgi:hypothetical protein